MNHLKSTPNRSVILVGVALSIFLTLLSALYFRQFLKLIHIDHVNALFFSSLLMWVILGLIFIYCLKFEKQKLLLWPEKNHPAFYILKSIIALMLILLVGAAIIGITLKLFGFNPDSKKLHDIVTSLRNNKVLAIFISLTAGVTEELIFRGYLISRLQLFFKNSTTTIIISSILFGILHINYGTIAQVIIPIFMGLVFGIHYQKYRNIKILILCHFLWDSIILLLLS